MDKEGLIRSLKAEGFQKQIADAFAKVPREEFVPKAYRNHAYIDCPIPIGPGRETTSQPYTIAFMIDKLFLRPGERQKVLEIGSGSGYVLALIYEITKGRTMGLELKKTLAEKSAKTLERLGYKDIEVMNGSGFHGFPEKAPYDRILVSAACPDLENAKALASQLKEDGIIVASVRDSICRIIKKKGRICDIEEYYGFVFVPLES